MDTLFAPPPPVSVPLAGGTVHFPVHRVYCVGRNYAEHAQEMGHSSREAPFFFCKPADAVLPGSAEHPALLPYPGQTSDLHHEVELVVALGSGGRDLSPQQALQCVAAYGVGLDMTRRDLQAQAKKQGRPWCTAKGFDHSAPLGPLLPAAQAPGLESAAITLHVNGQLRQQGRIADMIWPVADTLAQLSQLWELCAGDLVFTGTPAGVGAVLPGDVLVAQVQGLPALHAHILPR
ncbi:MAG: fumarylacetoacetate hydrolase family protein [Rhodoferax sp.]